MNENLKEKLGRVEELTKKDIKYKMMLIRCRALERRLEKITSQLSQEEQNAVWDFVMLCEDMSDRKLTLACEHMEFSSGVIPFPGKRQ